MIRRVQAQYASLPGDEQESVKELLDACHVGEVLDMKLSRDIGRENNLEVWL